MLTQYLKIAFRNLRKHQARALIAILGLAFAVACFVPALYWVEYEKNYDSFYPDASDIYRVYTFDKQSGKENSLVSGILWRELNEHYPAMHDATVFFVEQNDCKTEDIPYARMRTIFTDSTFFSVFPQVVLSGEIHQPLQIKNNIVLSESMACRLFGSVEKAVGQKLQSTSLSFDEPYTVTAVVRDAPANTNLAFDAILSHDQISLQKTWNTDSKDAIWNLAALQMYVKLPSETDTHHLGGLLAAFPAESYDKAEMEVRLLPIADVRHQLNPDVPFTLNFIRVFVVAGVLLMVSALFNFLHLHLGLFYQRLREFHLRSVNGASRGQLVQQMLTEIGFSSCCTLIIAFGLTLLALSAFANLLGIQMETMPLLRLFALFSIGLLGVILLAGLGMFWRISRLATAPYAMVKATAGRNTLQSLAVVFQLVASIVFIVATLVVTNQMNYVRHKDLGFEQKGLLYLSGIQPFLEENIHEALKKTMLSIPQIESITYADFTPQHQVNPFRMTTNVEWEGKESSNEQAFNYIITDSNFDDVFHVKMLAGQWLAENGEDNIVLNETAVRVMGLENPVGSILRIKLNEEKTYRVVGVVKDFHTTSLRNQILPTFFTSSPYPMNNIYFRTVPGQEQETIARINAALPGIDASFSDASPLAMTTVYDRLNNSEQVGLRIFSILAVICLVISLIGIYAVALASTRKRRKEIAIRKVMGATVEDIVRLFFREYVVQVAFAGIIALPVAYSVMGSWLQGYAYRTDVSWAMLMSVLFAVLTIVLLSVFGQVFKAANGNPAEVVKSE